jgi:hypothetical protein
MKPRGIISRYVAAQEKAWIFCGSIWAIHSNADEIHAATSPDKARDLGVCSFHQDENEKRSDVGVDE